MEKLAKANPSPTPESKSLNRNLNVCYFQGMDYCDERVLPTMKEKDQSSLVIILSTCIIFTKAFQMKDSKIAGLSHRQHSRILDTFIITRPVLRFRLLQDGLSVVRDL